MDNIADRILYLSEKFFPHHLLWENDPQNKFHEIVVEVEKTYENRIAEHRERCDYIKMNCGRGRWTYGMITDSLGHYKCAFVFEDEIDTILFKMRFK